jgi:hypothetical protein
MPQLVTPLAASQGHGIQARCLQYSLLPNLPGDLIAAEFRQSDIEQDGLRKNTRAIALYAALSRAVGPAGCEVGTDLSGSRSR